MTSRRTRTRPSGAVFEKKLLAIIGPTASGKSSLAMEVARKTGAEILSADSMQVYRGMDIGTAKPTAAERAQVPHHLFDCVDPTQQVTAGEYARQARQILEKVKANIVGVVLNNAQVEQGYGYYG